MIKILPLADVIHQDVFFDDGFYSNEHNWEIINSPTENAFIKDGFYWMENRSKKNWMFYHKKLPVKKLESFIISAEIEIVHNHLGYGQFGLVWGFNREHNIVNKFTIASNHNQFTVSRFQKDHLFVTHRFSGSFIKHDAYVYKQFFSIIKLADYYYFYLNLYDRPVYITHVSQMGMEGERFGFYVEPGIMIRSDRITVKRLVLNQEFSGQLWMPLDKDSMPLGSEILRGN
jgi:hypothetical protein